MVGGAQSVEKLKRLRRLLLMTTKTFTTLAPDLLYEFLADYGVISSVAAQRALDLFQQKTGKSKVNSILQQEFGLLKRHANSIISHVEGAIRSARECHERHIKTIEGQIKSIKDDLKTREKRVKDYRKAKRSKRFKQSTIKDACWLRSKSRQTTQLQDDLFIIHQKKRRLNQLESKSLRLKKSSVSVNLGNPRNNFMWVGSSDESLGNQIAQLDQNGVLKLRVPYCLEDKYGSWLEIAPIQFAYGSDVLRVNRNGSNTITFRFYAKDLMWYVAATIDVAEPIRHSLPRQYGCIGVDDNPDSIGWAYVDTDGNLKDKGQFKLTGDKQIVGKSADQVEAILADVAKDLVAIAIKYNCPIAVEKLDFSAKKNQLRERGRKYARMLSGFAYSKWNELLERRCVNNGIEKIGLNPTYSSSIGLMKFAALYGLSSDMAAGLTLARRAMRLSERVPSSYAFRFTSRKHVWSSWHSLHTEVVKVRRRHDFYFTTSLNRARKVTPMVRIGSQAIQMELFEFGESPNGSIHTVLNAPYSSCPSLGKLS
jgi:IS605 OrfB family transposase